MTNQKHHQDCDCCGGTKAITPLETINRPGLDQIQYRIGTHPTFFETMMARLSTKYIEQPVQSITAWELTAEDVRNLPLFVRRLQKGGDPISTYLRTALKPDSATDCDKNKETKGAKPKEQKPESSQSDEAQPDETPQEENQSQHTQKEIYCWVKNYDGKAVDEARRDSLLDYLNEILRTELGFHASNQIHHLEIPPMVRYLLNDTSKSIVQINRLILDIAYPDLIISKLRLYPLNALTTRQINDPSIAMLDAWSTVADVLTFYQERFANEGYLPTATERRSVLELANLVGYKLRPGVSASTFLAFDIEKGHELIIPKGTRAQSIPGPGELPQAFETSQDFYAKDVWSKMVHRTTVTQLLDVITNSLHLEGLQSNLKLNDPLLVVPIPQQNEKPQAFFRNINHIEFLPEEQKTIVSITGQLELDQLQDLAGEVNVPVPLKPNEIATPEVVAVSLEKKFGSNPSEALNAIRIAWEFENVSENQNEPFNGGVFFNIKIEYSDESGVSKTDQVNNLELLSTNGQYVYHYQPAPIDSNQDSGTVIVKSVEIIAKDHIGEKSNEKTLIKKPSQDELKLNLAKEKIVSDRLSVATAKNRTFGIDPTIYWKSFCEQITPAGEEENLKIILEGLDVSYDSNGPTDTSKDKVLSEFRLVAKFNSSTAYTKPTGEVEIYSFSAESGDTGKVLPEEEINDEFVSLVTYQLALEYTTKDKQVIVENDEEKIDYINPQNFTFDNLGTFNIDRGSVTNSCRPEFRWNQPTDNLEDGWQFTHLYLVRDVGETAIENQNYDNTNNPLNTGKINKIPIQNNTKKFQPDWPILEPNSKYYWLLGGDVNLTDDGSVPDGFLNAFYSARCVFYTLSDEEPVEPRNNQYDVGVDSLQFKINSLETRFNKKYKIEIEYYGNKLEEDGIDNDSPLMAEWGSFIKDIEIVVDDEGGLSFSHSAPFKMGTRYRWRIKNNRQKNVLESPWWEFTTELDTDDYANVIAKRIILRTYARFFHIYNIYGSALFYDAINEINELFFEDVFDWDVEPLLSKIEGSSVTANEIVSYIELQKPMLRRNRAMVQQFNNMRYPETTYSFEQAYHWIKWVECELKNVEEQIGLVAVESTQDDLPFSDQILNRAVLEATIDLINAHIPSKDFVDDEIELTPVDVFKKLNDFLLENLTAGDISLSEEECQSNQAAVSQEDDPPPIERLYGLNRLIGIFENPDATSIEKILSIEGQLRLLVDYRVAIKTAQNAFEITSSSKELPLAWVNTLIGYLKNEDLISTDTTGRGGAPNQSLDFLRRLRIPPSIQVAEAPLDNAFVEQSNFTTQLLTTFEPRLRGIYYQALSAQNLDGSLEEQGAYLLKVKAALFAANTAESTVSYKEGSTTKKFTVTPIPIDSFATELGVERNLLWLDGEYKEILPGSFIVIEQRRSSEDIHRVPYRVVQVATISQPSFGKITSLVVDPLDPDGRPWSDEFRIIRSRSGTNITINFKNYRNIIVYAQNEPLPLARQPIEDKVEGNYLDLDGLYDGFLSGRQVVISGERADISNVSGIHVSEVGLISGVQEFKVTDKRNEEIIVDRPYTRLILANQLAYSYVRKTVKIQANVIEATHGETRTEILGNGDAIQANQKFGLKQKPLTHVAAPTSSGVDSELTVYVNDVEWDETENLVFLDKEERGFMTKIDNEDNVAVIFGDGKRGARLPTSVENIRAVYRSGLGKAGNVGAQQISMLATKPLGVKGVINPLAATGGVDREGLGQARENAPIPLFALDRLVSLKDYEDFTRAFAGVAKAKVAQIAFEDRDLIHLTVALVDDVLLEPDSALFKNMVASLNHFGTLNKPLQVDKRTLSLMICSIKINIEAGYIWEKVETAVRQKLLHHFGFDNRKLGQDVVKSELISVIQTIPGVAYADVDLLATISESGEVKPFVALKTDDDGANKDEVEILQVAIDKLSRVELVDRIEMRGEPQIINGKILPAEIAYFSPDIPDALILKEVRS